MRTLPSRIVLLGHPVSHSLSPVFQNAAIRAAGISATYTALDVAPEKLDDVVKELRTVSAAGNVTVPHKRAVFAHCDQLSATAVRTGAVNTFFFADGVMHGDNTDVRGFLQAARQLTGTDPAGQSVVVIGAGGSTAAVLAAVELMPGSTAQLFSRNAARARELALRFSAFADVAQDLPEALSAATLVVNATPVGMRDDNLPFEPEQARRSAAVLDLVYRAGETPLVRKCRSLGMVAANGREMLLEQGALAFMQWFDCAPNKMVMRKALEDAIVG